MQTLSLIIGSVFVLLFLFLMVRMVTAIGGNMRHGRQLRKQLLDRLGGLRLNRALQQSGKDPNTYVHEGRLVDVENQMRNCESCDVLEQCDQALDQGTATRDFDFCPNHEDLFREGKAVPAKLDIPASGGDNK